MKNIRTFLLCSVLLLAAMVSFSPPVQAQEDPGPDTTVVIGDDVTTKLPWLTILLSAAIAAIPTIAWARSRTRVGKFVELVKVVIEITEDRRITDAEFKRVTQSLKELIEKEEGKQPPNQ